MAEAVVEVVVIAFAFPAQVPVAANSTQTHTQTTQNQTHVTNTKQKQEQKGVRSGASPEVPEIVDVVHVEFLLAFVLTEGGKERQRHTETQGGQHQINAQNRQNVSHTTLKRRSIHTSLNTALILTKENRHCRDGIQRQSSHGTALGPTRRHTDATAH